MYPHQQIMKTRQDDMLRRADRARLAARFRAAAKASQPAAAKADISYFKRSYERADLHVTITGLCPRGQRGSRRRPAGR